MLPQEDEKMMGENVPLASNVHRRCLAKDRRCGYQCLRCGGKRTLGILQFGQAECCCFSAVGHSDKLAMLTNGVIEVIIPASVSVIRAKPEQSARDILAHNAN